MLKKLLVILVCLGLIGAYPVLGWTVSFIFIAIGYSAFIKRRNNERKLKQLDRHYKTRKKISKLRQKSNKNVHIKDAPAAVTQRDNLVHLTDLKIGEDISVDELLDVARASMTDEDIASDNKKTESLRRLQDRALLLREQAATARVNGGDTFALLKEAYLFELQHLAKSGHPDVNHIRIIASPNYPCHACQKIDGKVFKITDEMISPHYPLPDCTCSDEGYWCPAYYEVVFDDEL